jgi:hypothetical protein
VTDGWLTIASMGNAGTPFYDSIELDELHCPLIVHTRRLRPQRGGGDLSRGARSRNRVWARPPRRRSRLRLRRRGQSGSRRLRRRSRRAG